MLKALVQQNRRQVHGQIQLHGCRRVLYCTYCTVRLTAGGAGMPRIEFLRRTGFGILKATTLWNLGSAVANDPIVLVPTVHGTNA